MPRSARKRSPETTHHIMCRSIKEIYLFKNDNDKRRYLKLMTQYKQKFKCAILAYCLMDTHVHIQFDPQGCDISKFMHGLNLSYAQYYNKKYNRHGHVFQNRFLNNVIQDDNYNLAVSAYIHNNPKDILGFSDCVHTYPFSSYGIYINQSTDDFDLINKDFILSRFDKNPDLAVNLYIDFVTSCNKITQKQELLDLIHKSITKEPYEYRSYRHIYRRDLPPETIIKTVTDTFNIQVPDFVKLKYNRSTSDIKAVSVFLMRCLSNSSYKDICKTLGDITLSQTAKLNTKGFNLMQKPKYKELLPLLLEKIRVA